MSSAVAEICEVAARRLTARGDIHESYSADRIGMQQPVRKPFHHVGALWVCTSIWGMEEHEAYRLMPEGGFADSVTSYHEKTGTSEAAEAARNDPNGFYHGMAVKFAAASYVLCGPPLRFVAAVRPGASPQEPEQLGLF